MAYLDKVQNIKDITRHLSDVRESNLSPMICLREQITCLKCYEVFNEQIFIPINEIDALSLVDEIKMDCPNCLNMQEFKIESGNLSHASESVGRGPYSIERA